MRRNSMRQLCSVRRGKVVSSVRHSDTGSFGPAGVANPRCERRASGELQARAPFTIAPGRLYPQA